MARTNMEFLNIVNLKTCYNVAGLQLVIRRRKRRARHDTQDFTEETDTNTIDKIIEECIPLLNNDSCTAEGNSEVDDIFKGITSLTNNGGFSAEENLQVDDIFKGILFPNNGSSSAEENSQVDEFRGGIMPLRGDEDHNAEGDSLVDEFYGGITPLPSNEDSNAEGNSQNVNILEIIKSLENQEDSTPNRDSQGKKFSSISNGELTVEASISCENKKSSRAEYVVGDNPKPITKKKVAKDETASICTKYCQDYEFVEEVFSAIHSLQSDFTRKTLKCQIRKAIAEATELEKKCSIKVLNLAQVEAERSRRTTSCFNFRSPLPVASQRNIGRVEQQENGVKQNDDMQSCPRGSLSANSSAFSEEPLHVEPGQTLPSFTDAFSNTTFGKIWSKAKKN